MVSNSSYMAGELAPILTTLYSFYDVLFLPLLSAGPYVAMGIFSLALAGTFSIIYWFMLDIEKADRIKEKMKEHQDKMKEARENDENDKASEHMQKSMKMNQKLMMENFKPMIGTVVFVALIFPWLGATFAPTVQLSGTGPTHTGNLTFAGQSATLTVDNSTDPATVSYQDQQVEAAGSDRLQIFGSNWEVEEFKEHNGGFFSEPKGKVIKTGVVFVELPFSIPVAEDTLNWLGFYALLAMPLTYIFRKALGVT